MRRLLTFERLKWASFTHSAVYSALLVTVFTGPDGLKTVLGWSHGIGWIAMSLACLVALRLRVIDLRLAAAVAVLGGIGPFIGSLEFLRQSRSTRRRLDDGDADGTDDAGAGFAGPAGVRCNPGRPRV